ncbi:CatB-related O-acetyltransferase [Pectobacterium punjabense]|uniref:CatB-related O-acetyltransferase n=1 Tax=Pectobacterium punjabense TaxID=2108399 RepID=UPI002B24C7A0|nr:CatB-related O-acetyltransferase [Pectobacterium punjabense]
MIFLQKFIQLIISLIKWKKKIPKSTIINLSSTIDRGSKIGRYCYIGKNVFITKSIIGNYTSIANNVSIGQGEHKTDAISTNSIFYENEYEELTRGECIVGHDVWIGTGVVILRGVTIGNGAIIGANAVVTKDIPDFSIAVGAPARVIRKRLSENIIDEINEKKWWSKGISEARDIVIDIEKRFY